MLWKVKGLLYLKQYTAGESNEVYLAVVKKILTDAPSKNIFYTSLKKSKSF